MNLQTCSPSSHLQEDKCPLMKTERDGDPTCMSAAVFYGCTGKGQEMMNVNAALKQEVTFKVADLHLDNMPLIQQLITLIEAD